MRQSHYLDAARGPACTKLHQTSQPGTSTQSWVCVHKAKTFMQRHARYLHEGVLQQPDHSSFHLGTTGCVVVEEDTIGEAELRLEFVFDQVYCEPVFSY